MILQQIIEKIISVLKEHDVVFAYIFGSALTQETSSLSDIDIAVYLHNADMDVLFDKKLSIHVDICRALKKDAIDIVVLNTISNLMLIEEIIRTGIVIYDTNTSFREEFEHKMLHTAIDFKTQRLFTIGI